MEILDLFINDVHDDIFKPISQFQHTDNAKINDGDKLKEIIKDTTC